MTESEDYYFDTMETVRDDKVFVLIIYDIIDNKRRNKLVRFLQGYGFRVQKSAFEARIPQRKYRELMSRIPSYAGEDDSIRVYKIIGKGRVSCFGDKVSSEIDDVVVL